jgi:hypothetical protein
MENGCPGPPVLRRDSNENIFRSGLRVFDKYVEVAVLVEDAGIYELVLRLTPGALPIGLNQIAVGKRSMRIFIETLHVRVGRSAVEIEIILLDIFAMVALAVREAKQALLQNGIRTVP